MCRQIWLEIYLSVALVYTSFFVEVRSCIIDYNEKPALLTIIYNEGFLVHYLHENTSCYFTNIVKEGE